jgi:hypothetical protein
MISQIAACFLLLPSNQHRVGSAAPVLRDVFARMKDRKREGLRQVGDRESLEVSDFAYGEIEPGLWDAEG